MRLSNSEHENGAWRIGEVVPDFRLEDVWALPAQGGAEDFTTLLEVMASLDPANGGSLATRALFSVRYRVGGWLGWDDAPRQLAIPEDTETSLGARLPEDLRDTVAAPGDSATGSGDIALGPTDIATGPDLTITAQGDIATGPDLSKYGFIPLYRTDREWAAELSNRTVHAVMHLVWVEQDEGAYRGQMGVYVKPRGRFGAAYMAAIAPFRHRVVYPTLMRQIERAWNLRIAQKTQAGAENHLPG